MKSKRSNEIRPSGIDFRDVVGETRRVYLFPGGTAIKVDNVARICVRPSGGHRLETSDGRKFIIARGWLAIEVVADRWSP